MTLAQARKHYEYTLARFDEADRDDRGWRRVAMERAKEELDRLTVEPPPNPSEELVRLQLLASVMLGAAKELMDSMAPFKHDPRKSAVEQSIAHGDRFRAAKDGMRNAINLAKKYGVGER